MRTRRPQAWALPSPPASPLRGGVEQLGEAVTAQERRRLLLLWAACAMAAPAVAGLPDVIDQARVSVLPFGIVDPLASPRFTMRGTSFVVGDGHYVITNEHVTNVPGDKPPRYAVLIRRAAGDGDLREANMVAQDKTHDLSLLRIEGPALPPLRLAAADSAREGQDVALMGFPIGGILGFQLVTHRGIISSVAAVALPAANAGMLGGSSIAAVRRGVFDIYQLDANAYPGNSGGPLFDVDSGQVIGVVNKVLTQKSRESALLHPTGISYAIPISHVRALVAAHAR